MEELVEKYRNYIVKIIMKYKNSGIEEDDLLQEGLIALYKAESTFDEQKGIKFETYLTTLVNNRILDTLRKLKKEKENIGKVSEEVLESLAESKNMQDEYVNTELVREINNQVRDNFSVLEYNVWVLSQAYAYKDIAIKLKITAKKVDNILQKIKTHIKSKIKFLNSN